MAEEVVMPRLSDTMDSGKIAKWLKQEGDPVQRGEVIAEIETDKANMELESYATGVMARILVAEGETAALGAPIATIAADAAEAQALRPSPPPGAAPTPPPSEEPAAQVAYGEDGSNDVEGTDASRPSEPVYASSRAGDSASAVPASGANGHSAEPANGRVKASPLARRLAQEHGIELVGLAGTGPGGRITKVDVEAAVRQAPAWRAAAPQPAAPPPAPVPAEPAPQAAAEGATGADRRGPERVEMTRMQQTIARRMTAARFSAPDFVLTAELDVTEARALLRAIGSTDGAPRVGPNDLLIKAVALSLRDHPEVNAGWEGDGIVRYSRINVGNAVAIEGGLVVPVIVDADKKSLGVIATESKELIERARSGKLSPQEYEGGTFSVSNLGMYGIDQFTPVINVPEACILGVGAMNAKPVVMDGEVVVRDRMRVTLSCDHRVINGAQGAEFLRTLRRRVEQPMLTLL